LRINVGLNVLLHEEEEEEEEEEEDIVWRNS
jgi:hypothetical protein